MEESQTEFAWLNSVAFINERTPQVDGQDTFELRCCGILSQSWKDSISTRKSLQKLLSVLVSCSGFFQKIVLFDVILVS